MKKLLALTICLLAAGCSEADWDHALNYTGLGGDPDGVVAAEQPVTPAATTAAASQAPAPVPNSDLCRAVATQDATANDFDPATQQRVFARSYSQCVAMYTR